MESLIYFLKTFISKFYFIADVIMLLKKNTVDENPKYQLPRSMIHGRRLVLEFSDVFGRIYDKVKNDKESKRIYSTQFHEDFVRLLLRYSNIFEIPVKSMLE